MRGKKILITGAKGMLGSALVNNLLCEKIIGLGSEIDITNYDVVSEFLSKENPDIIIHTAAFTNVEICEVNIDKAYKINVIGTQNLVNCCIDKDILFIYISSTGVYGKTKNKAYSEFDEVKPTSIHHKSKYEGEKIVQNHLTKYLILRTGWLFGGNKEHNKNFVYKRFLEAKDKKILYSDNTQIGNPTYTIDFVNQIEVLIQRNQYGIFNCVNKAENISRYDYVKKIIELWNLCCEVQVAPDGIFKRIAQVSHNESATNYKLDLLGLNIMGKWDDSLNTYIEKLKSEF